MADSDLLSFPRQILPRQIRVHNRDENLDVTAMIAIVDYFHGPHRLASEELASSGLIGKEIPRRLIGSHPTNGTGYVSNALWPNSIPVHHPEENEFFAALRAAGDKFVVHKALFHPDFSARYNTGGASLSYDGDHGAASLLIFLLAFNSWRCKIRFLQPSD
jgi:hypothetical protein